MLNGRTRALCIVLAAALVLLGLCAKGIKLPPEYNSTAGVSALRYESNTAKDDAVCTIDIFAINVGVDSYSDNEHYGQQIEVKIPFEFFNNIYSAPQEMSAFVSHAKQSVYLNSAGIVESYLHRSDGKKRL